MKARRHEPAERARLAAVLLLADEMLSLLKEVARATPPELDATVSTFRIQLQKLAETGDPSVFSGPQLEAARATAHAFDLVMCPPR